MYTKSMYEKLPVKNALPCKECGAPACNLTWTCNGIPDGIGDITCSNDECRKTNGLGIHYSGKFCKGKKQAIKEWNEEQT